MSQPSKATLVPADPLIGHALGGKFTIKRLIGRGGVGLVYLAEQADRNREVVVKVLSPNWADDDEALARFEREAKRLSGLKHPNIVSMVDFGKEDRRAYLVMEYLRGEPLADFVERNRRLTLEQFVPIAAQILKGIGHAHSREMMVRDIKPANIMLCERKGRANFVKILDFGLAKLTKGDQAITEEHVMGTVGYLSPEQIRGEEIDLRVDVYALGVLFYYMLSGRLPFEGENNATVFYKTINEPPVRLSEFLPEGHDIPEGLVDLIHGCLEKDRDDRPTNADEVVEGLIDVVPAAMFRLPRAETTRQGVPQPMPPGHGNTGMMELLGTEHSPSSRHLVDSGVTTSTGFSPPSRDSEPLTQPQIDSNPSIPVALQTGPHRSMPTGMHTGMHAPAQRPVVLIMVGALLAVLGGGIGVWLLSKDDDAAGSGSAAAPPVAAVGSPAVAAEVDPKVVEDALAQADGLIREGQFDAATETLDEVRGLTRALPTLAGRIERADQRIAIGRLMAAGGQFEEQDKIVAATEAYRDVLELDPSHMPAREALARLDVDAGPLPAGRAEPEPEPSSAGASKARSKPKAKSTSKAKSGRDASEPEPQPEPEPEPEPEPKPAKKEEPKASGSPFLPTQKGDSSPKADEPKKDEPKKDEPKSSGSPFLPTKD